MNLRPLMCTLALLLPLSVSCRNADADTTTLRARGDSLKSRGEFDLAIEQYNQAIKLDSLDGRLLNNRGVTYKEKGDYERAIQDFNRALALNPNHAQALKNRGRTLFYLGRFADAAVDMQKALPFDSTNAYVVIWLYLAKRRLGQGDARELAAQLARTDTVAWPAAVGRYFLGTMTAEQLLASAALVDPRVNRDQRCAAAFFLGQDAMIQKRPAEALARFTEVRSTCPKDWTEYQSAVAELGRLDSTPTQSF